MFTTLPDRNNTDYPLTLENILKGIDHHENDILQHHQRIVHDFVTKDTSTRGIIVFNETGSGKTITAASIAMTLRETRDIILMCAKSLHSNFKNDIRKYAKMKDPSIMDGVVDNMINKHFKFVTTNASNMITKLQHINKSPDEIEYEKRMGYISDNVNLNGKLLIIDEAHNLFNSIISGGINANKLYDAIMKATDVKILFLTGTPVVNDPFELVPAYNMCAGYDLLPTDYDTFYSIFIDSDKQMVKNRQKFMNRIYGLTSYYGSWYQTAGKRVADQIIKRNLFPDQLPIIIEKINMSHEQYSMYKSARVVEKNIMSTFTKSRSAPVSIASRKPKSVGSSYRVQSRQVCNYAYPESAKVKGVKDISLLTTEHLDNLDVYSPKMKKIIANIDAVKDRTQVVYSSFVSGEGISIFAKILKHRGWDEWKPGASISNDVSRYAIYSGDINTDTRDTIVAQFNSNDNAYGKHIRIILISGAGSEGLNLYNCATIHIMEPYWNWNRIMQIVARVVRYKGHEYFTDPSKKIVQPYLYISDYPTDIDKSRITEATSDIYLLTNSINNRMLNERFYGVMIESSFDCPVHMQNATDEVKKSIKCMRCTPNTNALFHRDINYDMKIPNPCLSIKEREVQVNEIIYMGKKYYYSTSDTNNTINLYEYKKSINGYVAVNIDNTSYAPIIDQLYSEKKLNIY